MKKLGILNSDIAAVLANLGHTDQIAIGDCGLPIPDNVLKIDVSIKLGDPLFIDVLNEVMKDMKIEKVILAEEIKAKNINLYNQVNTMLHDNNIFDITFVSHEILKERLKNVKAVIRTGEATPYANIILQSGVIF
jgi:D-ribose pyranase